MASQFTCGPALAPSNWDAHLNVVSWTPVEHRPYLGRVPLAADTVWGQKTLWLGRPVMLSFDSASCGCWVTLLIAAVVRSPEIVLGAWGAQQLVGVSS